MSKTMHGTPLWLGFVSSNETFLSDCLAVVPTKAIEHLHGKIYGTLKYVQVKFLHYKRVDALFKNNEKFVQRIVSPKEANIVDY